MHKIHPPLVEQVRLRARRAVLWARHLWDVGASSAGQGLAITHAEVDRLLLDPNALIFAEREFAEMNEDARAVRGAIEDADAATRQDTTWTSLARCFDLSAAECDLLATLLAAEFDPGLRRVYAYLHDDVNGQQATQWLTARLFWWARDVACGPDSHLLFWKLAAPLEGSQNRWTSLSPWAVDPAIMLLVRHGVWQDPVLENHVEARSGVETVKLPCAFPEQLADVHARIDAIRAHSRSPIEIEIVGPERSGRRTHAAQLAGSFRRDLIVADCAGLLNGHTVEASQDRVERVYRMARAGRAIAYWHAADSASASAWQSARDMYDIAIFGRESASVTPPREGVVRYTIQLGAVPLVVRESIWRYHRDEEAPPVVRDRVLLAGEVSYIAKAAVAGPEAVRQAERALVRPPNDLIQKLPLSYSWKDLVLPAELERQLREFEQQARLRWPVYEEWGFGRLCPLGKGITALFAGPSGTGKTMAAQVVARSLELDLYRVDLAGVINKYIGETEKRLKQVFDHCERANVLLFFDEADALFGQRMQVKDSHDRFANIEIDYLLQRMEQFDGIAVLATNRKNDLDSAFLRRIRFAIDFLPPGTEDRLRLWKKALHASTPAGEPLLGEIDWNYLAEKLTMTGADIRNTALGAAFLARADNSLITMSHLIHAARRELVKHGVVLRASPEGT